MNSFVPNFCNITGILSSNNIGKLYGGASTSSPTAPSLTGPLSTKKESDIRVGVSNTIFPRRHFGSATASVEKQENRSKEADSVEHVLYTIKPKPATKKGDIRADAATDVSNTNSPTRNSGSATVLVEKQENKSREADTVKRVLYNIKPKPATKKVWVFIGDRRCASATYLPSTSSEGCSGSVLQRSSVIENTSAVDSNRNIQPKANKGDIRVQHRKSGFVPPIAPKRSCSASATVLVDSGAPIVLLSEGKILSLPEKHDRANYVPVEHMEIARKLDLKFFPSTFKQLSAFGYHRFPLIELNPNRKDLKEECPSTAYDQVHFISDTEAVVGQLMEEDELDAVSGITGELLILEYSEEFPVILSQIGMSSRIKNYYGKGNNANIGPIFDFGGEPSSEEIPFLGSLSPNESLQSVENNLFQAPIYRHQSANTDFLLIRKGNSWFIRQCPALFCVGQQCPMQSVPAPYTRSFVSFEANYILANMYRYFRASKHARISTVVLRKFFPEHYESSIPRRLKTCSTKLGGRGRQKDYYTLNPDFVLPPEEELMRILTPEMYCLHYSAVAALYRLKVAGHGEHLKLIDTEEFRACNGATIANEVACAPWNTSVAFLRALRGEHPFDEYGRADPTCCNQGVSYARPILYHNWIRLTSEANKRKASLAVMSREELMKSQIHDFHQPNHTRTNGITHFERVMATAGDRFNFEHADMEVLDLQCMRRMMNKYFLQYQFDLQNRILSDSTVLADLDDSEDDCDKPALDSPNSRDPEIRLIISRIKVMLDGTENIVQEEVTDPSVIEAYIKIRNTRDRYFIDSYAYNDEEYKKEKRSKRKNELRNARRKKAREKREMERAAGKLKRKTPEPRAKDGGTCSNCYQKGHHRNKPICPVFGKSPEEIEKYQDMIIAERSAQLQQNSDDSDAPQVKRPPKNYRNKLTDQVRKNENTNTSPPMNSDTRKIITAKNIPSEEEEEESSRESTVDDEGVTDTVATNNFCHRRRPNKFSIEF